jgi:hypothetical protein
MVESVKEAFERAIAERNFREAPRTDGAVVIVGARPPVVGDAARAETPAAPDQME